MPFQKTVVTRRKLLQSASVLAAGAATSARAQPGQLAASPRSLTIAQIVDFSPGQQDVSKDFLIGSRTAWQDINARGGLRGRPVQHLAIETDGTPANLRTALDSVRDNPSCIALSGSVGDQIASQVLAISRKGGLNMAHVAPWLQNASLEIDDNTFPVFAARQEQIAFALKTLSVMGFKELGAIYGTARDHAGYHSELERIAANLKIKLVSFKSVDDLRALGRTLTPETPAVLLFLGGTPELAQFTQGLEKQSRQRYVVAMADVNLQTLAQMGAARNTPVIATQPVPMVNASLPVVMQYRNTLSRLFDEPPTALSLAGFIAARYTFEVLSQIEGNLTRQSALTAFQRRTSLDVGGFRVSFDAQRRSSGYVTQSMMALDGRMVG